MTRPLAAAVVRAGIISDDSLEEIRRWGLPMVTLPKGAPVLETPEGVVKAIQDALDSGDQVQMRDTDLDLLRRYLDSRYQQSGRLVLKTDENKSVAKVSFCKTIMGEIVIPWRGENIFDLLLNGESHLVYEEGGEKKKVFFSDIREMFIGAVKAFMVCTPEA